jgi:hypothetical protein
LALVSIIIFGVFTVEGFSQSGQKDFLLVSTHANLQPQRTSHSTILLEAGGLSFIYSLNYEHFFSPYNISARIGVGSIGVTSDPDAIANASISYFLFSGEHHCELGLGAAYLFGDRVVPWLIGLRLGYRFRPIQGGFNFAITFTPLSNGLDTQILPWAGISLGWGF